MSSELTQEDVQRILKLVDEAEHLEELDLVDGDFRLHIDRRGGGDRPAEPSAARPAATPAPASAAAPAAKPASAAVPAASAKPAAQPVPQGMVAVRASMLGTFYRSPSPAEKPFVEIGQQVKAGDTVCLLEVMKLFQSIKAGVEGKIVEIRAQNGTLVEFNEVLFVIEPATK